MSENVENLILEQLRQMRAEMAGMRSEIGTLRDEVRSAKADIAGGFDDLGGRVDGVALLMTVLAGHVHALEERIEHLEARP